MQKRQSHGVRQDNPWLSREFVLQPDMLAKRLSANDGRFARSYRLLRSKYNRTGRTVSTTEVMNVSDNSEGRLGSIWSDT